MKASRSVYSQAAGSYQDGEGCISSMGRRRQASQDVGILDQSLGEQEYLMTLAGGGADYHQRGRAGHRRIPGS